MRFRGRHKKPRPLPDVAEPESSSVIDREGIIVTRTVKRHRRRVIQRAQRYRSLTVNTNQRVVGVSLVVLVASLLIFSGVIYVRLYRSQEYSAFIHDVTKIAPVPVGRVGGTFVPYSQYLSILRRQVHYFETQQQVDFDNPVADAQVALIELKSEAMQQVIDQIYIEKLAAARDIEVTAEEIDQRFELLQAQNKLGDSSEDIEDVLDNFWGISLKEYRQIVADNMLREAVTRVMDEELGNNARERMELIFRRLSGGEEFALLAIRHSEDPSTAVNGGEYNFLLSLADQDEDPQVLQAVFETPVGQYSDIVDTGSRLEIIKVLSDEGDGTRRAAHISISYLLLSDILRDIRQEEPATIYIDGVTYSD